MKTLNAFHPRKKVSFEKKLMVSVKLKYFIIQIKSVKIQEEYDVNFLKEEIFY